MRVHTMGLLVIAIDRDNDLGRKTGIRSPVIGREPNVKAALELGLAEVPGEGMPFSPEYHEALGMAPVTEKALDGKVIMVHTNGYAVNGKVLQAAQVIVGKFEQAEAPEA